MNILVLFKVVPDDQDIAVNADGSLDYSRAHQVVSAYDLNAIEAAAQLVAANEGSSLKALSVGKAVANDSKLRKNVLARGVNELLMFADDAAAGADTYATAQALKKLVEQAGEWDLVVCGDGSADDYNQQVDVQLASALDVPVVNGVLSMELREGALVVDRLLEDCVETLSVPLPAVVSVCPDIALPRIPGMRDILAAGKKPATILDAASVEVEAPRVEELQVKAPKQRERACSVYDLSKDGDLDAFVQAAVAMIR